MLKEKLAQVQKYESQAAVLIKKATDDSLKIIADAKQAEEAARRRAVDDAADKTRAASEADDAGIATEITVINEACLQEITALKSASAARIEKAAVEISRRVIEEVGR